MSTHFIILIPTIPTFVPTDGILEKAKYLFAQFLPGAEEIEAVMAEEIKFVDQGENFERVCCPGCGSELQTAWWHEAMDKAYETKFGNLNLVTPCCGLATSLNDLDYRWPAGFARCQLSARGPQQKEVSPEHVQQLEHLLGTKLRQIWVHY
jgi:hypothetical protein